MKRAAVLREVLAAFDRSAASSAGSMSYWLVGGIVTRNWCDDLHSHWTEAQQRAVLIAYVRSCPASDLREVVAITRAHLRWLACFERRNEFEETVGAGYAFMLGPEPMELHS